MRVWYAVLALVNLLAGGFLVVATYGFGDSTAVNIGFGLSIAVLCLGVIMGYVGFEQQGQERADQPRCARLADRRPRRLDDHRDAGVRR